MQKIVETLSSAKAPKKDGKGNPYADVVRAHMPITEVMQTASMRHLREHSVDKDKTYQGLLYIKNRQYITKKKEW